MSPAGSNKAQPIVALIVTILGMAITSWAAFTHTAALVVPGATLITLGGAWLGNALARADVRIFPVHSEGEQPPGGEAA